MRNGVLYELQISELPTREKDGLRLPTPVTSQVYKPIRKLTPSEKKGTHGKSLPAAIGAILLPTPMAHVKNNPHTPSAWNRKSEPCIEYAKAFGITKEEAIGKRFLLNPQFVEEMMGFPIGWTELKP
jgi:hypothetical protein